MDSEVQFSLLLFTKYLKILLILILILFILFDVYGTAQMFDQSRIE